MSLCHNRDLKIRLGTDRRRFGGDVSSMEWRSGAGTGTRSYDFAYDGLGRLVSADYGEYGDHVVGYGTSYSYDNMGNLLSLSREGDMTSSRKGIVDNLSMTYDGNMLASVSDSAPAPSVTGSADFRDGVSEVVEYTYDRNGNMTSDLNRKVSLISYNRQNRPARMRHAGGTETFTYLPDGTKRGRTVLGKDRSLSRTEYRGNLVCADDTLKYILFDGGLIAMDGASPEYLFFLRDHLGSVRVVARPDGKAVQVNHYYPYGMAFAGGGMSGNAGAHPVEGGVSVAGGSLEIGSVDAREVATDAAVGAVVGGASRVFPFNTLENANKKATSHLSPSNYVETARKDVKKEWRATGKGLSGQSARAEFRKEVSDRANNLYKVDVLLIDSGYNMAGYTVNNVVQMEASHLIQKQNDKRD